MNTSLSALIITHNEEQLIRQCLESISWINEIILVDDFSEDQTIEIAREFPQVKFISHKLTSFGSQRNIGLQNCSQDWVLVIDADERVTKELQEEIIRTLSTPGKSYYNLARKNIFMDRWIRFLSPDYNVRLFRREGAFYIGDVHESLSIKGPAQNLKHPLIHYPYRNIDIMINKMNYYATLSAAEKYRNGRHAHVTDLTLRPLYAFGKHFFLKLGIFDGVYGFAFSFIAAYYTFVKYFKLYLLEKKQHHNQADRSQSE